VTDTVLLLIGPSVGGIRRHVAFLADALEEQGWTVAVAGPERAIKDMRRPQRRVEVVPVGMPPWRVARAMRRLRRVAAGVDVVHAHGLTAGWCAAMAPGIPPVVVTVHNVVIPETAGRNTAMLRALERRLPRRVDAIIATSKAVAERMTRGRRAPVVIPPIGPPPVPRRSAEAVRAWLGVEASTPLVVCLGRLHAQKGLETLIDSAAILRQSVPDVVVAIVGEGPQASRLVQLVERAGLLGTVRILGPSDDGPGELAAADVVVVTSVWESGPLVVAEAMALGKPVVSTPVGFVPALVTDGETGRLVPIGDAQATAAALAEVLGDRTAAARMGRAGQVRVAELLAPEPLVAATIDVYRATLTDR
jgi:glycosyltransferase involved in cell wall biosynthesis